MLTHRNPAPRTPVRVVVLGRDGFIPKALVRSLTASDWNVLALGKDTVDLTLEESVTKLAEMLRPTDALVMTSALTPEKGKDTATLIRNLRMSEHVAAAIAKAPCAQLVYFSSDSIYGWEHSIISESTSPSPDNLYGVMHLAREIGLREACKKAGIAFGVLRACGIYGQGDTHNAYGPNRFVRTALKDNLIELFGSGDDTRDHVYIDDVIEVTRLVLQHRSEGLMNLVSGAAVTFSHVADEIIGLTGRPIKKIPMTRATPPTRRSFAVGERIAAFPAFRPTSLRNGLGNLLKNPNGT